MFLLSGKDAGGQPVMLIDGRTLPGGHVLRTDLCIIGAGAAGITLALAFADQPVDVCLVEGGGFDLDGDVQELCRVETQGVPYEGYETRLRMFGGSTNHWGGWCRPMEERTFEPRPWVPHSGWPIRSVDLAPYYDEAARLCEISDIGLGPEGWASRLGLPALDLEDSPLRNMIFDVSPPTRFGEAYRQRLLAAGRLTICLNSSVTGFERRAEAAAIERVSVQTLAGNRFEVGARCFVLACGGIENPRLLLCSKHAEGGLADLPDTVGRFFMEHAHFNLGHLALTRPWDPRLYLRSTPADGAGGMLVNAHLGLRPEVEESERLAIVALQVRPRVPSRGEQSLARILGYLGQGRYPDELGHHLLRVLSDLGTIGEVVEHKLAHRLFGAGEAGPLLAIRSVGEQVPNPDSRIMLAETKDALGLPRALIDWRLAELDRFTLRRTGEVLAAALGRLGLGRMQLAVTAEIEAEAQFIEWGYHHMGTTRMDDDPKRGVVDRHCRLHVAANLYLAGSSVFPTGGAGTPTLTIVALALRLAGHLKANVFV
jgi:choline dehydrogenase-like flavoprotein